MIIGASPALAALLGFLSLKERPTRRTMFVILVVLLGIGLIFWSDAHAFEATLENLYALGMALCLAANIVLTRATAGDSTPFLAVAGALLALAWFPFAPTLVPAAQELAPLFLMGGVVGLLMLLEAVFGPLWVWIWLSEAPGSTVSIAGIALVGTLLLHHTINLMEMRKKHHGTHR